jgi:hypothetical protein
VRAVRVWRLLKEKDVRFDNVLRLWKGEDLRVDNIEIVEGRGSEGRQYRDFGRERM